MYDELSPEDRLLLLKFLCAFAWADLDVSEKERAFVQRMTEKLSLGDQEKAQVEQWLEVAPAPSSVRAESIPSEHKRAFIDSARAMIYVDGHVDPDERESFDRLKAALGQA